MKTKTFSATARTFRALQSLAEVFQTGTRAEIRAAILKTKRAAPFKGKRQAQAMLANLLALVDGQRVPYSIFAVKGNGKLPFVAFSTLPGVTCPGAGSCLEFCYSFNAWRFAHAFGRQAQNCFLMRFDPEAIRAALSRLENHLVSFDLRLYVDGDFASREDVAFWFAELNARPLIRAYGYSKSFFEILSYPGAWPSNYKLNLSSGHSHSAKTLEQMRALPITRGEFRAVSIGRKVKSAEHGTRDINAAIRARSADKVFCCPGKCGTCVPHGHACGSARFVGIPIAIAIH